jgi:uncharacterized protein YxjI
MGILQASVWDKAGSKWIASNNDEGNIYRHEFKLTSDDAATITRARAYVAGD